MNNLCRPSKNGIFRTPLPHLSQNFHTKKFFSYEGVTKSQISLPLNVGRYKWMTPKMFSKNIKIHSSCYLKYFLIYFSAQFRQNFSSRCLQWNWSCYVDSWIFLNILSDSNSFRNSWRCTFHLLLDRLILSLCQN